MSSPDDDNVTIADEDMFVNSSQISMFNSEVLENNMLQLVTQVNDDGETLSAMLTQDFLPEASVSLPSSFNPFGKYPAVEEFCLEETNCSVSPSSTQGSGFAYSEKLQKLFVKPDSLCSFDVRCALSNIVPGPWFIRIMLVSLTPESQHEPITRCHNHSAKDVGPENLRQHVLRCKNEQHEYIGIKNGPFFEDRCAVRVPLDVDPPNAKITLQFVCQNTCFNLSQRRTGLVFTLESEQGHIYARRVLPVKICINFRRDMLNEEKAMVQKNVADWAGVTQQPSSNGLDRRCNAKRSRKRLLASSRIGSRGNKCRRNSPTGRSVQLETCSLSFDMPSMRMAKRVLDNAIGMISASVLRVDDQEVKATLMAFIRNIRLQRETLIGSNSQCSVDSDLF
ncbi:uncharacterized protein LOC128721174 [Anopheles nili]|uniref:uncharacterized protein LOC128721174 n=1 Tax=Anopheles nili TaxID=185578 RepID=UPI00237B3861|nr:uncharacterized protein LOC128721174 [Anopheles nili]